MSASDLQFFYFLQTEVMFYMFNAKLDLVIHTNAGGVRSKGLTLLYKTWPQPSWVNSFKLYRAEPKVKQSLAYDSIRKKKQEEAHFTHKRFPLL